MDERIKAAVDFINENGYVNDDDIFMLKDLAERYLKIEMPEKKKCEAVTIENCGYCFACAYNHAIDQCKLSILKKLEGVEEIIVNSHFNFDIYLKNLQDKTKRISIDKSISDAIKQYLVGGKK